MTITSQRINTNGIYLDVHQAGPASGELVILLHGFPEHGMAWEAQIEFLASQGYRVWAPDQRGYAGSDKPQGAMDYQTHILALDIIGLADAAGAESFHLVGHDWGAAVAWILASNHAQRLKKLVILNVPHPTAFLQCLKSDFRQVKRSWYMFAFLLPKFPEWLLRRKNYRYMRNAIVKTAVHGTFSQDQINHYLRLWSQPQAISSMVNWYRAGLRKPSQPRLAKVPVPVRIIWGRKDPFLLEDLAELSLSYCEDGEVTYLDQAGHWLAHEAADTVNELILSFIQTA